MRLMSHTQSFVSIAICWTMSGLFSPGNAAEVVQTDEYIYVAFEAEDYATRDERWVVTDASTPAIEDDPDGNHSDTASGGVYLELLPDIRVTHEDPFGPPTAYWGTAGTGPQISYTVDFPEAGRYYVHGRAYSTGTEDNGVHVGLNSGWPLSGRKMQFCTAGLGAWAWRSSQRDAGGQGSCGIEKTVYLDIPSEGVHTITVSGREDGFELDRIALIKDKSDNTRICSPKNVSEVTCKNGSIESADEFVDLSLLLTADNDQGDVGDTINFVATLENLDAFDTATDIEISIAAGAGVTFSSDNAHCEFNGDNLVCTPDDLAPTTSSEFESFEVSMVVSEAGQYVVEATVSSAETDELPENNNASLSVVFDALITSTDIDTQVSTSATDIEETDVTTLSVTVSNTGELPAEYVTSTVTLPDQFSVTSMPVGCAGLNPVLCVMGDIAEQDSATLEFGLTAESTGTAVVEVAVSSNNDSDQSNNDQTVEFTITEKAGGDTAGGETGGSGGTDGGVDTSSTENSDAGSTTLFILLALLIVVSTRLDGLNKRNLVVVRKQR